jgi:hypothetical protein
MAYEAMCKRHERKYCKTTEHGGYTGPELMEALKKMREDVRAANTPSLRAAPVTHTVTPEMAAHLAKIEDYQLAMPVNALGKRPT